MKVDYNSTISIQYKLSLEDGTEVESNFEDEPLELTIGDKTLTDGMEDALIGLKTGETIKATLSPEQAYGYPNEENIHNIPIEDFPDDMPPEVGQVIAFDAPTDGDEILGTIIEVNNTEVQVDFSHPLAGRTLIFEAEIKSINMEENQ